MYCSLALLLVFKLIKIIKIVNIEKLIDSYINIASIDIIRWKFFCYIQNNSVIVI